MASKQTPRRGIRRVLALIAARSGSKGLRHKNLRRIAGTPLLVHAIHLALASARRGEVWSVVVSTDSAHYARIARRAGAQVPSLRPAALAADGSRLIDAVLHTLEEIEDAAHPFDAVVLLSATTPLTRPQDVRAALRLFATAPHPSVASVTRDPIAPSWRFMQRGAIVDRTPRRHHVGRRQEADGKRGGDPVYLNGALYVASPAWLRRHRQFVRAGQTAGLNMPAERSVDIETHQDLAWAAWLMGGDPPTLL